MTSRRGSRSLAGRRLNRRDFLKMSGAGLAGATLFGASGCGGGGGASGPLVFSMGPDEDGSIAKLIDKFNKQSDFKARHREMPADTGQYYDKLRTEFQAGGGGISVIGTDVIWPKQFAPQGWTQDLSDRFPESAQNKFVDVTIEAAEYEDGIFSVPWSSCPDVGLIYYRKDLLEQAGISEPPQTWDDLEQMALQVSQQTGTSNGFVFQGSNYEGGVCNALEYIWTHGGEVLDENNKIVVDSPETVAGLETYRRMVSSGAAPQAVANMTETESSQNFYNGDAVFIRYWPSLYGGFGDPATTKIKPEQIGIAPIPVAQSGQQSYSTLGGWEMSINANTERADEAWEFIEFMTSEDSLRQRTVIGGYMPSRQSLFSDPKVAEATPVVKLAQDILLGNGKPRPVTEYYGDMSLEMQEQFNAVLNGDTSPQQAAKTLQESLSSIMEQAS